MAHRHAVIKDKAFSLPQSLLLGHLFKIFKNAALEMIDFIKALFFHIGSGLLTANTAGAEHGDLLIFAGIQIVFGPLREFPKAGGLRIYSALKGTNLHLIIIARVY